VSTFVAKRVSAATRGFPAASKTDAKRICPEFFVAVPVWHCWQVGSSNQPVRVEAPTTAMPPWQLWHCISIEPSAAVAAPIAPRRHFVSEPG
jgi:hypothetical protein